MREVCKRNVLSACRSERSDVWAGDWLLCRLSKESGRVIREKFVVYLNLPLTSFFK